MFARTLKAGLVTVDPTSGTVGRVIAMQYNPETVTRTLALQSAGSDPGQPLRLKGVAVETIRVEAHLDATDELADATKYPDTVQFGIHPQLAALASLVNPTVAAINANQQLAAAGSFDALAEESPLTLMVWSRERVVPVRLTELGITEELFDTRLNPIRAKVSLALRVLSVDDLGVAHHGGGVHLAYLGNLEKLAARAKSSALETLGVTVL
ncbi:hypothetical protein MINS_31590 [Mycolicibacterium insubricum]|uniref:Uncharacterized protein n=1 Tax=Mycolicibacterium insubricum TaxID=444597 RepID=A0A1X0D4U0_9MYCO|nr:hypothetical protein [Mycolicibacterium insubricum]MCB9441293.1 hypothetical protein [Mycolicibacterium sp.]MCV7083826.1 hypothetical protein [Mycolicibacterium insubricum]ORA67393.1 hypothetical protein BST26_15775 [Mycolicibacterium insubricum]BBZ67730.1 hypothetical protein MINS_31590 [Mycolicibacterium insubricum]